MMQKVLPITHDIPCVDLTKIDGDECPLKEDHFVPWLEKRGVRITLRGESVVKVIS